MGFHRRSTPPFGQHFLHDLNLLSLIVHSADLSPGDMVVEVGVGTGKLTRVILDTGASVTGVEIDPSVVKAIEEQFGGDPSFRLVQGDILRIPWDELLPQEGQAVLMGNLPYAASTQVIFRVLQYPERVSRAVFLVQWEVGRRLAAEPGNKDFGIMSVACQLYGRPRILRKVAPGVFLPPPRVDSALVRWDVASEPVYPLKNREFTSQVVKAAFAQRRKKLVNSLASKMKTIDKITLPGVLEGLGLWEGVRAEQLTVEQFARLSNRLYDMGIRQNSGIGQNSE
ncbi:MAG: ribosomal RNA small subunit methyltransferase A [Deltaproteobacteria bacterium]|nr:ribosomal RNA small subunit methyltransferase A [Deltaproteobacteria bacterium]